MDTWTDEPVDTLTSAHENEVFCAKLADMHAEHCANMDAFIVLAPLLVGTFVSICIIAISVLTAWLTTRMLRATEKDD